MNFNYKDDPSVDYVTLIEPAAIRDTYISMETLWLCTENSPIRYMIDTMRDILPEIQEQVLMILNSVINLCMVKGASGKSFKQGFFDCVNCSRECRLRRRVFKRLTTLLPLYKRFEKKCLNRIFKLSTKYWMNKDAKALDKSDDEEYTDRELEHID